MFLEDYMDAIEALTTFISKVIHKPRAVRYKTIIDSQKRQIKFIRALDHEFEQYINPDKIIQNLESEIWASPVYSFEEEFGFRNSWNTFKEAYDSIYQESILIITQNGEAGLFISEFPTDDIYLKI